jgi:(1->4)-alpha-D-glucan 1-alpha-D-glucosylmutase
VTEAGRRSALGQAIVRFSAPGIPDVYGGDELEYLALVDPDNRRPVDYDARRAALAAGDAPAKLRLIRAALALRARRPQAFGPGGAYEALDAGDGVVAYFRGDGDVLAVVPTAEGAVPRLAFGSRWRDVVSGEELRASEIRRAGLFERTS